jgi:hypothetical protein
MSLTSVPHRNLQLGAAPYSGPQRPKLWHEKGETGSSKTTKVRSLDSKKLRSAP